MTPLVIPGLPVDEELHSRVLQSPLARARGGIMLHYDDSSRDDWSVAWFRDPRCTNGYTWLVLRSGRVVELADPAARTPHAGWCRTPDANSFFYGVSAATDGVHEASPAQLDALIEVCVALCLFHRWPADCITGHDVEAIWTKAGTRAAGIPDARAQALWGKTGRKVDPTGVRADGVPIIHLREVRAGVEARMAGGLP